MFPSLQGFVASASLNRKELFAFVSQHLKGLVIKFFKYFSENENPPKGNFWIVKFFTDDINSCNFNAAEKESLIKLARDTMFKVKRKNLPLS